jgi:hypothetical protein
MTDPLAALRGDIELVHPLERARQRGEAAELREERAAELERQARREEAEAHLAQRAALDRAQLLARGYTDSELAHHQAQQDAVKEEKIAELEAELAKLDPARAAVKRAETVRAAQDLADRELLARAREPDPFMAGQIERFHRRRGAEVSRSRLPFDRAIGRSEQCLWCIEQNVDDETSYLLHSDPELNVPVTPPGQQPELVQQSEVDRLRRLGYSPATARLAAVPYRPTGTGWPVISR